LWAGTVTNRLVIATCVLVGTLVHAQAPLEFDVASIKRNTSGEVGNSMRTLPDGTEVMVNSTVRSFIGNAYQSQSGQYVGLPDWATTERFDVTVKPPAGSTREQPQQMWKAFFTERMKLVAHDETSEQPIYNLVLTRRDGTFGPNMKRSPRDCLADAAAARDRKEPPKPLTTDAEFLKSRGYRLGAGHLVGGISMDVLALVLRGIAGRTIRNQTGLSGWYAVDFSYSRAPQADASGVAPDPNDAPSVFTAIQEQLGLKLEPDKMPIQHVVIDHIARSTEN
jgi:uncharacterized protein (TIGR03435 family)